MSLITDLVSLVDNLDKKLTDRKMIDAFLPIKKLVLEVEREQFNMEKRHLEEMQSLQREHRADLDKLSKAIAAASKSSDMTLVNGVYRIEGSDAEYCPACYESKNKKHTLAKMPDVFAAVGRVKCQVCKAMYQ